MENPLTVLDITLFFGAVLRLNGFLKYNCKL